MEAKELARKIGWAETEAMNGDNLAILLVTYFEDHYNCPADSPVDDERGGWKVWALDRAEEMLLAIAEEVLHAIEVGDGC